MLNGPKWPVHDGNSPALAGLIQQIWPDLPRNQAIFSSFDFIVDSPTMLNANEDGTLSMSISSAFHYLIKPGQMLSKLIYSVPLEAKTRITTVLAAQYNQPATFIYGGLTQHMEYTGYGQHHTAKTIRHKGLHPCIVCR